MREKIEYEKVLKFLSKVAFVLLIFWLLIHQSQLQFELIYQFFNHSLSLILIIILLYMAVVLNSLRWYRLNYVQYIRIPFIHTMLSSYLGMACNNVLPGNVGGDIIRFFYFGKKFPNQKSAVALSIFLDRICGFLGMFIVALVMVLYFLTFHRNENNTLYMLLNLCISIIFLILFLFFIITSLLNENAKFGTWLIKKTTDASFGKHITTFIETIYSYRNSKWVIFESIAISVLSQVILLICNIVICNIMSLPPLSPAVLMFALAVGQVASLIPLTPGGIGIGETAFANIIMMMNPGVSAAYATVFLAFRLITTLAYLPGVMIGIFGYDILAKQFQVKDLKN